MRDAEWALATVLRERARTQAGHAPSLSAAILDVKMGQREARSYDAGKLVKRRKRHLLVDTQGWLLKVVVSFADVAERAPARPLAQARQCFGPAWPRLTHVWANSAYAGHFVHWAKETMGWTVEIAKHADGTPDRPAPKSSAVQPHRWIAERTLGRWSELHRLAKDFKYQLKSSEAIIYVSMTLRMLRRLARAPG